MWLLRGKGSASLSFSYIQGCKGVILELSGATFVTWEENFSEIKIHTTYAKRWRDKEHIAMTGDLSTSSELN